jgi:hypothetical protein
MNKIFLLPYKERYFLCLQEDEEQAKENFLSYMPTMFDIHDYEIKLGGIFYTDDTKRMQIKKESNVRVLTEGKDYAVNYVNQNNTIVKITLKSIDHFPITVRKHSPIEPLVRLNPPIKLKEKIINVLKKLSHEKSQ